MERPLRLRLAITEDGIAALQETSQFQNLAKSKKKDKKVRAAEEEAGRKKQAELLAFVGALDNTKVWMDRAEFLDDLDAAAKVTGIKLLAPIKKAIVAAFGERDENAAICRDKDGNPEPDPKLRDYEYVPLRENIYEYFEREVKPFVDDAWIDESKVEKGCSNSLGLRLLAFASRSAHSTLELTLKVGP